MTVTQEVTTDGCTDVGFGERLYSAFSILETQDGQCRFDRRKEVVAVGECGSSDEVVESMLPIISNARLSELC